MIISRLKRKENIAEYILYMWNIEDLIRAYNFNLTSIEKEIISQFEVDENTQSEMVDWYDNLIQLMMNEKVEQIGHIQVLKNIIEELTNLHYKLLNSPLHREYKEKFEEILPFIGDLLEKVNDKDKSLIEIMFEALYGIWMMKLNKQQISKETQEATNKISEFISLLAAKFHESEEEEISF